MQVRAGTDGFGARQNYDLQDRTLDINADPSYAVVSGRPSIEHDAWCAVVDRWNGTAGHRCKGWLDHSIAPLHHWECQPYNLVDFLKRQSPLFWCLWLSWQLTISSVMVKWQKPGAVYTCRRKLEPWSIHYSSKPRLYISLPSTIYISSLHIISNLRFIHLTFKEKRTASSTSYDI